MFSSSQTQLRERLRGALAQDTPGANRVQDLTVTTRCDLSSLGGHWFETPAGRGYAIDSWYDAGHSHGSIPLYKALSVDTGRLAAQARDPRITDHEPRDFLYIDTETTGLGGAGSMVFLAGVARFKGAQLLLRQFLLPSPSLEAGFLEGLAEELESTQVLVSFNGKSFDLPALESRAIMTRRRPAWRDIPHLDLLHPNRRLFKGSFETHRLVQLETELLGFKREDDCPSAEVPVRYFRFHSTGDPTWIRPVLRHNAWDILSLVALCAHLAAVCNGDAGTLQAARAAEYERDWEAAATNFERVAHSSKSRTERTEACEHAARAYTRLDRFDDAARMWLHLIDDQRPRRLLPLVELAKLSEHRFRDSAVALRFVESALALIDRGHARPGGLKAETGVPSLERRKARLARRMRHR